MNYILTYMLVLASLFQLSGCSRILRWGKYTFCQAHTISVDISPAYAYVRTLRLYDQFNTVAIADVIWLSDTVRTVYADLYSCQRCKSPEHRQAFLRRQLQENNHFITFYVLMPKDSVPSFSFGTTFGIWSVTLVINGTCFSPREVKAVDLAPEYQRIFGNRYNRYKSAYLIQFDACNLEGHTLISPVSTTIHLVFKSIYYSMCATWQLTDTGTLGVCQRQYCNKRNVL